MAPGPGDDEEGVLQGIPDVTDRPRLVATRTDRSWAPLRPVGPVEEERRWSRSVWGSVDSDGGVGRVRSSDPQAETGWRPSRGSASRARPPRPRAGDPDAARPAPDPRRAPPRPGPRGPGEGAGGLQSGAVGARRVNREREAGPSYPEGSDQTRKNERRTTTTGAQRPLKRASPRRGADPQTPPRTVPRLGRRAAPAPQRRPSCSEEGPRG